MNYDEENKLRCLGSVRRCNYRKCSCGRKRDWIIR